MYRIGKNPGSKRKRREKKLTIPWKVISGIFANYERRATRSSMEFITVELRPRLRSCNVFVRLFEGTDPDSIKVKLNKDFFTLRVGKCFYNLSLVTIRIIPTSLSCLRVAGCWVSFRIQTTPLDSLYGSFVTELVGLSGLTKENCCLSSSSTELPPKEVDLVFSCSCCENAISKVVKLKKVLPLPNNDCDPGDFFCCSHENEDYSRLLEPRDSDYFYGSYYAVLKRENFTEKLKINTESVVCNRCLAVIGVPNSKFSLKVWNCCVEYAPSIDNAALSKKRSNPLADFKAAVKNSYRDGFTNERILLEAKECGITRYLLIKPMEWNLDLLVEPREIQDSKATSLLDKRVVKVLYDYGEANSTFENDRKDAKRLKIGLRSMLAGMEHLLLSSKRVPPIYRNSDEHHIGYMSLDMSDKT